jgi:hypothetical protein
MSYEKCECLMGLPIIKPFMHCQKSGLSGGMAEWLTRRTGLAVWVQTPSGASRCFLEQETLHSLLSTGWFKERIRKCVYKLIASYTIELT